MSDQAQIDNTGIDLISAEFGNQDFSAPPMQTQRSERDRLFERNSPGKIAPHGDDILSHSIMMSRA